MRKIAFGYSYTDIISGFEGVAVGFAKYITGCDSILLVPPAEDNNKRRDGEWFDIDRLELLPDVPRKELVSSQLSGASADGETDSDRINDPPPVRPPRQPRYRGRDVLPPRDRRRD